MALSCTRTVSEQGVWPSSWACLRTLGQTGVGLAALVPARHCCPCVFCQEWKQQEALCGSRAEAVPQSWTPCLRARSRAASFPPEPQVQGPLQHPTLEGSPETIASCPLGPGCPRGVGGARTPCPPLPAAVEEGGAGGWRFLQQLRRPPKLAPLESADAPDAGDGKGVTFKPLCMRRAGAHGVVRTLTGRAQHLPATPAQVPGLAGTRPDLRRAHHSCARSF